MNTSDKTDEVVPALVAALHQINNVTKDSAGHHGKYATLNACLDAVKPVLEQHDLALHQHVVDSERGVCVRTRIWHKSGQWVEDDGLTMPAPNDPQKVGGSVTYARRYSLTTFFGISTEDDDGASASRAIQRQNRPPRTTATRPQQDRAPSRPTPAPTAPEIDEQAPIPDDPRDRFMVTDPQIRKIAVLFGTLGIKDRDAKIAHINKTLGTNVASSKELTLDQAKQLINQMEAEADRAVRTVEGAEMTNQGSDA